MKPSWTLFVFAMAALPCCSVYGIDLLDDDGSGGGSSSGGWGADSGGSITTGGNGGFATGGMASGGSEGLGGGSGGTAENLVLVDDLEQGPAYANDPFFGQWDRYDDGTPVAPAGWAQASVALMIEPREDDADNHALHVKGTEFMDWGVGVFLTLQQAATASPVDISSYDGLRFFAKADSPSKIISVKFADVASHLPNCEDAEPSACNMHAAGPPRSLSTEWREYRVAFPLPARVPPFVPTEVFALHFTMDPPDPPLAGAGEVDFWLDDIAFYKDP